MNHNGGLSWSFDKDDPVPDDIVDELYKQLNPTLQITKERFSNAVNALPAMSENVVVGSDPSVNNDLVDIINEEFGNGSILFSTDAPMANANGPHIDACVIDSYTVSSNSNIATSPDGMITDLPWREYDRLRQYLTEYKDGFRVAISAALPLMALLAISSIPGDPNLLVLDACPAHARVRFDKNTKILNSGSERVSRYVLSYSIRSCKIGLVMGDDAKATLLKVLEEDENLLKVELTDDQLGLLIDNYPKIRAKYGLHKSNPIWFVLDQTTDRASLFITCRQPSFLFAGGDMLTKMGTLESITSMLDLFDWVSLIYCCILFFIVLALTSCLFLFIESSSYRTIRKTNRFDANPQLYASRV